MKNILVAVDLEKGTLQLINTATSLAEKNNSKVWVLHIAEPEPDFVGNEAGPRYIRVNRAKELRSEHKLVHRYTERLKTKNIKAEGLLIAGATVDMIMQEINKLKIDFVIIGHRKHSFLYKMFFPSTDTAVIKKSKVPVLVIPV